MSYADNYDQLWRLIAKRREAEKILENNFPITNKTNYNFQDIHGLNLLHYAAIEGNAETIAELVTLDVDLNQCSRYCQRSALQFALEHEHLNIAKTLHVAGVSSANLRLRNIKNPECREWAHNIIAIKLKQSKYDIERKIQLAAMVGELDLLKQYRSEHSRIFIQSLTGASHTRLVTALVSLAITHGQLDIVKYLLTKLGFNSTRACTNDMLLTAINEQQTEIAEFLLAHYRQFRLAIDHGDLQSRSALIIATQKNNDTLFEQLLLARANPRVTDRHGNNCLHYIAISNNAGLFTILSELMPEELNALCRQHNIYGETPIDVANRKQHVDFFQKLKPHSATPYAEQPYPGQGFKTIINHNKIERNIAFYLSMNYQDSTLFELGGHCNGLSFLFLYYAHQQRLDYFYDCLQHIASWDGKEESLEIPLDGSVAAEQHNNLHDLFEKWTNDITWFQQNQATEQISQITQYERHKQMRMVSNIAILPGTAPLKPTSEGQNIRKNELNFSINNFMQQPAGSCLELRNRAHVCTLYRLPNDKIAYYDANVNFAMKPFDNSALLASIIYKHLVLHTKQLEKNQSFLLTMKNYRFADTRALANRNYAR